MRVNRLGPEATSVGRAVAILGIDAELRRVAELARVEPETVAGAVSGLRREGILNSNGRLDFIHPLVRTAVYSDIAEPDRGLAHLQAARILDEDGHHERVATHLLVAESNGDAWVVDRLRDAASSALTNGVPASAAALLERAMAEPAPAEERPVISTELGRARTREGRLDAAVDAFELAHKLTRGTDEKAAIALELGMALRLSGRTAGRSPCSIERSMSSRPGMAFRWPSKPRSPWPDLGLPAKDWSTDSQAWSSVRAGRRWSIARSEPFTRTSRHPPVLNLSMMSSGSPDPASRPSTPATRRCSCKRRPQAWR